MECGDIKSVKLDNGENNVRPNKYGGYHGFGGSYNEDEPYQGPYYDRSFNLRKPDHFVPSFDSYSRGNLNKSFADF